MSVRVGTRTDIAHNLAEGWQEWWLSTTDGNRLRFQLAAFAVGSLVAYHYSLSTLISNLSLSTPLAYIGLVPVIAIAIAAARGRPRASEHDITDRQLDWIVGVPLLAAAAVIVIVLPNKFSAMFWVWRLDLLSFPLFVAGTTALLFGTRTLWRQKFAVGYLLLAWPLPYTLVLLKVLNSFTSLTLNAMKQIVTVIPVAKAVSGGDGSIFQVLHHGTTFPLSVVSACSGVDSVVGFLLVGSAFAALVRGNRAVKTIWLLGGMALLWVINLGRILFIFWAGRQWGEHVAINILHPFVGLVTFSLGVVLMMLVMPLIGLHLGVAPRARTPGAPAPRPAVTSILPAVGVLAVAALLLGVTNSGLKSYDLVANSAGEPRLASYSAQPAAPTGWAVNYETTYNWAKPYFGEDSSWLRYLYYQSGVGGDLRASLPVTADVINTGDLNSFSAYGVEACYNFHNYAMRDVASVKLAGGINGQSLSYSTGSKSTWTIVYWIMPVKSSKSGGSVHYERVILYIQDTPGTVVRSPGSVTGIHSLQGALDPANVVDRRLIAERNFLVLFAREVIVDQTHVIPGARTVTVAGSPASPATPAGAANSTASTAGSAPATTTPSAATLPAGSVDPALVRIFKGNIKVASEWQAMTPKQRIAFQRANPLLFLGR